MATDLRYIKQRHQCWYCVRDVPRKLRGVLGKKRFIVSLDTRDIHVARARRWAALKDFQKAIDAATKATTMPLELQVGLAYREQFAAIEAGDVPLVGGYTIEGRDGEAIEVGPAAAARELTADALRDALSELERDVGYERAKAAADIAYGRATPLLTYVDQWLAEGGTRGPVKPRTGRQYRTYTAEFEAWLRSVSLPPTIEAVTKKIAGRYVTDALSKGAHRKTINAKASALSAYWTWLVKRGHAEANHWTGQSLPKLAAGDAGKRPFTDPELRALFTGDTDGELRDAMLFAALSGMRIEEIYRLTVADCAGGWFNIRQAKSKAGVRRVPIHPDLTTAVARRTKGADPAAYLFDEPGPARAGRERSTMASKRFGHYRQRVGVHDKAEGRRQSRVDFHSFRRWFVTAARSAGNDRAVVAAVVGHEVGNITDDTYSGGPSDAQRVACVNSVGLPEGCIVRPADAPVSDARPPRRRTPSKAAPQSPQTSPPRPASRPR